MQRVGETEDGVNWFLRLGLIGKFFLFILKHHYKGFYINCYSIGRPKLYAIMRLVFVVVFLYVLPVFFVFRIAVLPHSPGVVYYHLLLRRETRILGVAPFSFRIGIWDLFVHRGQKSYTPTAFGKLWTTPGVRCIKHDNQ